MAAFKTLLVLVPLLVTVSAIPMPAVGAKPFTLKNGQDAIALNQQFSTLTPDSSCTSGSNACINGQFAKCAFGKFVLMDCAAGTVCAALPLVNSPGTSVTCTTQADRDARIAATGATSSGPSPASAPVNLVSAPDTASASDVAPSPNSAPAVKAAAAPASNAGSGTPSAKPFALDNGKKAQALNQKFTTLTANSPCTDGEFACIGVQFAKCAFGKFVLTPCGATLHCAALPLVNSPGTSVTCVDLPSALQRFQDTGAGRSLTGA